VRQTTENLLPFPTGGQAKRVNIGLGLVAHDTRLLFLDEPTSGLDSFTANEVALLRLRCIIFMQFVSERPYVGRMHRVQLAWARSRL